VTGLTYADVDLLDTFTETTLASLPAAAAAADDYRVALNAVRDAPSDLPIDLDDHAGEADELLATLEVVDRLPSAFAFALRVLDARPFEVRRALPRVHVTVEDETLTTVAHARVAHPTATASEVLQAAVTGAPPPLEDTEHPLEEVVRWTNVALTAGDQYVERRHADLSKRQHADLAKRLGRASGYVGAGLLGLEQWLADAADHNYTTGQRLARSTTTAAFDGAGAAAGGLIGGTLGNAVGSVPGAVAGAVGGSEVGAQVGRRARSSRWGRPLTGALGSGLDRLLHTHHRDDYDDRLDLEARP
jgi:hypothetical protein